MSHDQHSENLGKNFTLEKVHLKFNYIIRQNFNYYQLNI